MTARKLSPSRSPKQQKLLDSAKNYVPDLGERVPPRSDRVFTRPGLESAGVDLPVLLERVLWLHVRRGAEWDAHSEAVRTACRAHSWGYAELDSMATTRTPIWLAAMVPGRRRAALQLAEFALSAHRSGALGALISYTEIAALCDVSPRTAQRWARYLEAAGILEIVQTWRPGPEGRQRGFGRQLYRPGPAMRDCAGLGMLEGARDLKGPTAKLAARVARVARARTRATRAEKRNDAYKDKYGAEAAGVSPFKPRHGAHPSPPPSGSAQDAPVPGEDSSKATRLRRDDDSSTPRPKAEPREHAGAPEHDDPHDAPEPSKRRAGLSIVRPGDDAPRAETPPAVPTTLERALAALAQRTPDRPTRAGPQPNAPGPLARAYDDTQRAADERTAKRRGDAGPERVSPLDAWLAARAPKKSFFDPPNGDKI